MNVFEKIEKIENSITDITSYDNTCDIYIKSHISSSLIEFEIYDWYQGCDRETICFISLNTSEIENNNIDYLINKLKSEFQEQELQKKIWKSETYLKEQEQELKSKLRAIEEMPEKIEKLKKELEILKNSKKKNGKDN